MESRISVAGLNGVLYENQSQKLAVLLHPYGPLGGNCENHVIITICNLFISHGYSTLRIDMRGSGSSPGSASWTGQPECNDLIEICKDSRFIEKEIILIGYSFGSVIACYAATKIPNITGLISISYPTTVLWAITAFNQKMYVNALGSIAPNLAQLFVIGSRDNFSTVHQWHSMLDEAGVSSKFREVIDSNHFFNSESEIEILAKCLLKKFIYCQDGEIKSSALTN